MNSVFTAMTFCNKEGNLSQEIQQQVAHAA